MKSQRPIFFTIGANCLDHKAPVIYKLATETEYPVDVVFWDSPQDGADHLVNYLRKFDSVTLYSLDEFVSSGSSDDTESSTGSASLRNRLVTNIFKIGQELPTSVPERMYDSVKSRYLQSDPRADLIVEQIERYDDPVLVFDWDITEIAETVITKQDNPVLAFPHGDRTFQNAIRQARILKDISPHVMVSGKREFESVPYTSELYNNTDILTEFDGPTDPDYYRYLFQFNNPEKNSKKNLVDQFVVPNEPAADKFSTFVDADKIETPGSPRYNDEWLEILSEIAPAFTWDAAKPNGLNVVLFLRSFHYFLSRDMLYNTINIVTQFPQVNLVISEHPTSSRLYQYHKDFDPKSNLNIVKGDVPSVSLLNWGDVFLDVGSSIVYEAIQRNKPILALDYLHGNSCVYSELLPSVRIDNFDGLYYAFANILEDETYAVYDTAEREMFRNRMIRPKGDVLDNCVEIITSHL